jgi:MGT family glycosyltransferase
MVPDLLSLADSWSPDVIVRDPMEFAGCLAAEYLGIPHTACGPLFCFWQGGWHNVPGEVAKPDPAELRRVYGLPPDRDLGMLYRYLYLAFLPPAFLGPQLEIPSTAHFLRPISFDQAGSEGPPAWLSQLPKRPTVHGSFGTIFHRTPGIFQAIIEALRGEDINLILAVGRDQDPDRFGPQLPNVSIERYIPHTLLLPSCDLVITHGGFSSVMVCLTHGLPMVLLPLAGGDQRGNAERCAALGVGRVVPPGHRTPEVIREAVFEVLQTPAYRQSAGRLRQEMEALPGPEYAVTLLEKLVVEKTPQLALR